MPIYEYRCDKCDYSVEVITTRIPEGGPNQTIRRTDSIGRVTNPGKKCSDSCNCSSEKSCDCVLNLVQNAHSIHPSWSKWRLGF